MRSLLCLSAVVVGCGGVAGSIEPKHLNRPELAHTELLNGKFGNLRFETEATSKVAVGAKGFPISVARHAQLGHTVVGDTWPEASAVRFELSDGLQGAVDARAMPSAFTLSVDCLRAGTFELRVALDHPGGQVADSFDVVCVAAERLDSMTARPTVPERTLLGGTLSPSLLLYAGSELLWGRVDLTPKDSTVLQTVGLSTFKALRPAQQPVLTGHNLEYALPIEIVDVPWSIRVALGTPPNYPSYTELSAVAVDAEGASLLGLTDCTFSARQGRTETVLPAIGCKSIVPNIDAWAVLKTADQLCVTAMGKSACTAIER